MNVCPVCGSEDGLHFEWCTLVKDQPLFAKAPVPLHRNPRSAEREAAKTLKPQIAVLRAMVAGWLKAAGAQGLTGKEAGVLLARHRGEHLQDATCRNTAAPRLSELIKPKFGPLAVYFDKWKRGRAGVYVHVSVLEGWGG